RGKWRCTYSCPPGKPVVTAATRLSGHFPRGGATFWATERPQSSSADGSWGGGCPVDRRAEGPSHPVAKSHPRCPAQCLQLSASIEPNLPAHPSKTVDQMHATWPAAEISVGLNDLGCEQEGPPGDAEHVGGRASHRIEGSEIF